MRRKSGHTAPLGRLKFSLATSHVVPCFQTKDPHPPLPKTGRSNGGLARADLRVSYQNRDLLSPDLEFSRTVLDRDGNVIFLTTTSDGMLRLPTTLNQIAPEMLEATLEMEDRRFFSHSGVDIRSILRAGWGVVSGQRLGGGSTITMQLSRLRWSLRTRSMWGKSEQMFRAIQLERHYSKQEIASAYFTIAPYGGNVEGVRAASFRWCGKSYGTDSTRIRQPKRNPPKPHRPPPTHRWKSPFSHCPGQAHDPPTR